jgi:hypothetical protein
MSFVLPSGADDRRNYRAYRDELKALPPGAALVPHLGAHTVEITMQDQLLPTTVRVLPPIAPAHDDQNVCRA